MKKTYYITHKHIFFFLNIVLALGLVSSLSNASQSYKNSESSENKRGIASVSSETMVNNSSLEDLLSIQTSCESQSFTFNASHIRLNLNSCSIDKKEIHSIKNLRTQARALIFKSSDFLSSDFIYLKPGENSIEVELNNGERILYTISRI